MVFRKPAALAALMGALFLTACAGESKTVLTPGTDLSKAKTAYVVRQPKDTRGIDELIKTKLEKRGLKVGGGAALPGGYPADLTITYEDRWFWEFNLYLIELTIQVRDPKSNYPLASGNAVHQSPGRRSPEFMVDEVLENIFNATKK